MTRTSPDVLAGAWLIVTSRACSDGDTGTLREATQRPPVTRQEDRRRAPVLLVCLRVLRAQPIWNEFAPRMSAEW